MVTYHKHGHGLSQSVGWIGLGPKNLGLTFDWVGLGAMLLFYFIMTSQKSQVEVDDHAPSAKNAMVHMQSPVADPEFSNRGCPPPQCGWGLGRGLCPLRRKSFYAEIMHFCAFLTVICQPIPVNGGRGGRPPPESATGSHST